MLNDTKTYKKPQDLQNRWRCKNYTDIKNYKRNYITSRAYAIPKIHKKTENFTYLIIDLSGGSLLHNFLKPFLSRRE